VIAITGGSHTSAVRRYSLAALIAVECGVFALGAALIRISMRGSLGPAAQGLLLGVASGVLFGVSDVALKTLGIGKDYELLVDRCCFHGLADSEREQYAEGVAAVAAPGARFVMFAFQPRSRGLGPRGITISRSLFTAFALQSGMSSTRAASPTSIDT
jgi:hypothetical protein